jgi:hypothetical protein
LWRLNVAGPIDSVDQWAYLSAGGGSRDSAGIGGDSDSGDSVAVSGGDPRTEVLLAGIDTDKKGAAIRVDDYKLLVGMWGADTWCDLNITGYSPAARCSPWAVNSVFTPWILP